MRSLVVHFAGGTEVTIQTAVEPSTVYAMLGDGGEWIVVEDESGERHYLAVSKIAYLTFRSAKGIGFA